MKKLFIIATLCLGHSSVLGSTNLPSQLVKSVKSVQSIVRSQNCQSIIKAVSSSQGITYFKQGEMGDRSKEFYFHFTKVELTNAKDADFEKFCEPFKKCSEYVKMNEPNIKMVNDEGIAEWKIFEGHHVGNHRDCSLAFILENKNWKIKSIDFPFDFTP